MTYLEFRMSDSVPVWFPVTNEEIVENMCIRNPIEHYPR